MGDGYRRGDFDVSGWREGRAPLAGRHPMFATRVGPRRTVPDGILARREFAVEGEFKELKLRVFCEGACVVYLNGTEVFRDDGAGAMRGFSAVFPHVVSVSGGLLKPGRNVISAEVTRAEDGAGGMLFDAALAGR